MKVRGSFSIMPLLMRAPAPEFILQCNKQHLGGVMQVTPLLQGGQKASRDGVKPKTIVLMSLQPCKEAMNSQYETQDTVGGQDCCGVDAKKCV